MGRPVVPTTCEIQHFETSCIYPLITMSSCRYPNDSAVEPTATAPKDPSPTLDNEPEVVQATSTALGPATGGGPTEDGTCGRSNRMDCA